MAFKKPKKFPEFADLKGILAQSKDTENSLYQTVQEIIERLTQLQQVTQNEVGKLQEGGDAGKRFATRFATFLTKNDDTAQLPNSFQLVAGTGIIFDTSVPNKFKISSGGGSNHYDAPLTDGDPDETDLIFANGECIIVQVPV